MSFVDVLIIGGGPAGLSAALTLVRQRHTVIVFDTNNCRAEASAELHGVLGFENKSPAAYLAYARNELQVYDCYTASNVEVSSLKAIDGGFQATDKTGATFNGKKVILANGVSSVFPDIPGYAECWGKGIFHNLFAQAYQSDPSKVHAGVLAVDWIAMPQFTYHLTHMSSQLAHEVTIYTNGNEELAKTVAPTCHGKPWKTDTRKIAKLARRASDPDDIAVVITFEDGTSATEAFLGHSPIAQLRGPFAEQMGLKVAQSGGEFETTPPFFETTVRGVYAAGDNVTPFKVWPSAVASGAQVAAGVAVVLQEKKWNLPPIFG